MRDIESGLLKKKCNSIVDSRLETGPSIVKIVLAIILAINLQEFCDQDLLD